MKPIILQADKDGFVKIKTSELKKMFDDVYNEGYRDGQNSHWWTYTTPYYNYNTTDSHKNWWDNGITISSSDAATNTITIDPNTTIKTGSSHS